MKAHEHRQQRPSVRAMSSLFAGMNLGIVAGAVSHAGSTHMLAHHLGCHGQRSKEALPTRVSQRRAPTGRAQSDCSFLSHNILVASSMYALLHWAQLGGDLVSISLRDRWHTTPPSNHPRHTQASGWLILRCLCCNHYVPRLHLSRWAHAIKSRSIAELHAHSGYNRGSVKLATLR